MYKEKPNIQTKKHSLFFPKIWHDEKAYTRDCSFVHCPCLKEAEVKGFFFFFFNAVFQLHLKNHRELASLHTKHHELCLHCLLIAL